MFTRAEPAASSVATRISSAVRIIIYPSPAPSVRRSPCVTSTSVRFYRISRLYKSRVGVEHVLELHLTLYFL
jgi:hypothetical protein